MLKLELRMNTTYFEVDDLVNWSKTAKKDMIMGQTIRYITRIMVEKNLVLKVLSIKPSNSGSHPQDLELNVPGHLKLRTWMNGKWLNKIG